VFKSSPRNQSFQQLKNDFKIEPPLLVARGLQFGAPYIALSGLFIEAIDEEDVDARGSGSPHQREFRRNITPGPYSVSGE
jgi:hypothetical protein